MMKRKFRDEWTAALRSGRYQQGRRNLNNEGRFCCIGVRCDLDVQAGLMSAYNVPGTGLVGYYEPNQGVEDYRTGMPPVSTLKRWGIYESKRFPLDVEKTSLYEDLVDMNDNQFSGKSFEEIADYLDSLPVEEDE